MLAVCPHSHRISIEWYYSSQPRFISPTSTFPPRMSDDRTLRSSRGELTVKQHSTKPCPTLWVETMPMRLSRLQPPGSTPCSTLPLQLATTSSLRLLTVQPGEKCARHTTVYGIHVVPEYLTLIH